MRLFTISSFNKVILPLFIALVVVCVFSGCASTGKTGNTAQTAASVEAVQNEDAGTNSIDYLVLVNKQNVLPEGWEESLEIVKLPLKKKAFMLTLILRGVV